MQSEHRTTRHSSGFRSPRNGGAVALSGSIYTRSPKPIPKSEMHHSSGSATDGGGGTLDERSIFRPRPAPKHRPDVPNASSRDRARNRSGTTRGRRGSSPSPERLRVVVDGEIRGRHDARASASSRRPGRPSTTSRPTTSGWIAWATSPHHRSASGRASPTYHSIRRRRRHDDRQRRVVVPGPEPRLRGDPRLPGVLRRPRRRGVGRRRAGDARSRAGSTAAG